MTVAAGEGFLSTGRRLGVFIEGIVNPGRRDGAAPRQVKFSTAPRSARTVRSWSIRGCGSSLDKPGFSSPPTQATHKAHLRSHALHNVPDMHAGQHCTQGE